MTKIVRNTGQYFLRNEQARIILKPDIYFAPFDNSRRKNKIFKKGVIFVKKGKLETFLVVWSESLM